MGYLKEMFSEENINSVLDKVNKDVKIAKIMVEGQLAVCKFLINFTESAAVRKSLAVCLTNIASVVETEVEEFTKNHQNEFEIDLQRIKSKMNEFDEALKEDTEPETNH